MGSILTFAPRQAAKPRSGSAAAAAPAAVIIFPGVRTAPRRAARAGGGRPAGGSSGARRARASLSFGLGRPDQARKAAEEGRARPAGSCRRARSCGRPPCRRRSAASTNTEDLQIRGQVLAHLDHLRRRQHDEVEHAAGRRCDR